MFKMRWVTFDAAHLDDFFATQSMRDSHVERFYRGYTYFFFFPFDTSMYDAEEQDVEMMAWCVAQFGPPVPRWAHFNTSYGFRDAADAMVFRMRWG